MNNLSTKFKALIGLSLLTVGLISGCGDPPDKPEIKQCADAGGIPLRSVWDEKILAGCTFKPTSK